jgi:hypothetical protein
MRQIIAGKNKILFDRNNKKLRKGVFMYWIKWFSKDGFNQH